MKGTQDRVVYLGSSFTWSLEVRSTRIEIHSWSQTESISFRNQTPVVVLQPISREKRSPCALGNYTSKDVEILSIKYIFVFFHHMMGNCSPENSRYLPNTYLASLALPLPETSQCSSRVLDCAKPSLSLAAYSSM